MRLIKVPRHLSMPIALMLCLALCLHGQEASDPREMARQLASAANDNAISLEERQESLRKLEEAARLFLSVDEKIEAARVLNRAGRLQLILHRPQDAIASHSQALSLLSQSPATELQADGLNGLGAAYIVMEKKKDEAETALRQALSLSEQARYIPGQAQALLTLSESQNTYNHALALQTAQSALALWQTLDDKPGLARTHALIGQYYMAQNILPESTQNYELSLALWRQLNNPPEQAKALISLGYIEHREGEWSNAISFYTQAQSLIDERAEPEKMGQIATGLAAAFNENGMPEIGLTHFQRALDYFRRAQHSGDMAYAMSRVGVTHYLLGNNAEAITHLQQARALVQNDTVEAECDEYLGRVYLSTGDKELARQHLQSALAIYTQAFNPKEVARVQALMGQLAEQQGQTERARQYYQSALQTFTQLSDRVNQAAVFYAQGRLELKNSNYDAAENYLLQSIKVTEDIRRISRSSDLTAAFSATVYERYEKYIDCLMRKHAARPSQELVVQAYETSELARARSLAELLRATTTNLAPGLDSQLAEQETSLRQSLRVKEDYKIKLLSRKKYQVEELTALDAELARLDAEYKQLLATIRERSPAHDQLTRPVAWDLRRIQEEVIADDQTVLLEYCLGENKSYVWAVTRNSITSYELPAQALINDAAQKVYDLLATPPISYTTDELTPATQELSRMILSPVSAQLTKPRIIVVADGALNYIPFQVLSVPTVSDEPLVANYEVVNIPSASILGQLREATARRQAPPKVLAAFGDPVFASNYSMRKDVDGGEQVASIQTPETERWQLALRDIEPDANSLDTLTIEPLFYAKGELANLSAAAGEETFVATGFDATRERLQSTDLTQYAILHFATHGILDAKRPENSGLFLSMVNRDGQAQNGFVGVQDIYNLRAPVELVVLSACSTGLGKEVRGEGLIGLTRGFMYAGAPSVVASLWKVDDKATAELMKRFYTNMLQQGMTPAAALRASQNSIRQDKRWRSPYYWAMFTLQGDYRQVIKPTFTSVASLFPKMVAGVALLSLLLAGAWWYRRRRLNAARSS